MKILLKKKPQNPTVIEGFPGFGLIGTIVTEFLIDHLDCELIGEFIYDDLPAMVAIHKGKMVRPMAVHYSKKHNLVILQTILNSKGKEWDIADSIIEMLGKLNAKKLISIEGVASQNIDLKTTPLYYYGDESLKKLGLSPISESIVVGVTSSIMLRYDDSVCIFAETASALPDSKAAASVIDVLNKYLNLGVDSKPLLKQAQDFEAKLKTLMKSANKTSEESDKKYMSYLG